MMENLSVKKMIIETLKKCANDESIALTDKEIALKVAENYPDFIREQEAKHGQNYKKRFKNIVAATMTEFLKEQKEGEASGLHTIEKPQPRRTFYSGFATTERQDAATKEQGKINTKKKAKDSEEKEKEKKEKDMYETFKNYLKKEYKMKRVEIVEHTKSNKIRIISGFILMS